MLPYRVSNPGPLTYESDALPIALRGPAASETKLYSGCKDITRMGPTYFMSGTNLAGLLSRVVQIWCLFCCRIKKKVQMAPKNFGNCM